MNSWRIIPLCCVLVSLLWALPGFGRDLGPLMLAENSAGVEKKSGLGDLREWLKKRNLERQVRGVALPDMPKGGPVIATPRLRPKQKPKFVEAPGFIPESAVIAPVPGFAPGPDGRIRHRYLLNEGRPDEMQVYSGSAYQPASPDADALAAARRLDRFTERGKQAFEDGASLRDPAAYLSRQAKRKR